MVTRTRKPAVAPFVDKFAGRWRMLLRGPQALDKTLPPPTTRGNYGLPMGTEELNKRKREHMAKQLQSIAKKADQRKKPMYVGKIAADGTLLHAISHRREWAELEEESRRALFNSYSSNGDLAEGADPEDEEGSLEVAVGDTDDDDEPATAETPGNPFTVPIGQTLPAPPHGRVRTVTPPVTILSEEMREECPLFRLVRYMTRTSYVSASLTRGLIDMYFEEAKDWVRSVNRMRRGDIGEARTALNRVFLGELRISDVDNIATRFEFGGPNARSILRRVATKCQDGLHEVTRREGRAWDYCRHVRTYGGVKAAVARLERDYTDEGRRRRHL